MIGILVSAETKTNVDPIKSIRGCWKKGYPIVAKMNPIWSGMEKKPSFIRIKMTDTDNVSDIQEYIQPINRVMSHTIVEHDSVTDTFKVRMHADSTLGKWADGEVTLEEMQPIVDAWNGKQITKHIDGGVYAEFMALDVIKSCGYFSYGEEENYITYTEESYNPVAGEHNIEIDYSSSAMNDKEKIEKVVKDAKADIVSHDDSSGKLKIKAKRDVMMIALGDQVSASLNIPVGRARYCVNKTTIDLALKADNGILEMTKDNFINCLEDLTC